MEEDQGLINGGHRFDQMSNKREESKTDRISKLPDELLHHILSFLNAYDVVTTCVLSRRWRRVWATAPCLSVHRSSWWGCPDRFVAALLLYREPVPLDTFRLCLGTFNDLDILWIQYAVRQKVRVLEYWGSKCGRWNKFEFRLPMSYHLKRLTLVNIELYDAIFPEINSQCPMLDDLELRECSINVPEIFLRRVRKLAIFICDFGELVVRAPSLITLQFDEPHVKAASFKDLSSLVDASINLEDWDTCSILEGLSNAQKLELLAPLGRVILEGELQRCPTFSNLKTLSLGGWCMSATSDALVCLLRHSPVLEKLILHINMDRSTHRNIMGDGWEERKRLFTCKYLKMVEIKYCRNDEKLQNLVDFLHCNGISHKQIKFTKVPQGNDSSLQWHIPEELEDYYY